MKAKVYGCYQVDEGFFMKIEGIKFKITKIEPVEE